MVNPRLHSNPFITKRQLNPSRFGNNKYKLIVLPLFVVEAASHSQRLHKTQPQLSVLFHIWQLNITLWQSPHHFYNSKDRTRCPAISPRICPVGTQFWPDIVRWPAVICSLGFNQLNPARNDWNVYFRSEPWCRVSGGVKHEHLVSNELTSFKLTLQKDNETGCLISYVREPSDKLAVPFLRRG